MALRKYYVIIYFLLKVIGSDNKPGVHLNFIKKILFKPIKYEFYDIIALVIKASSVFIAWETQTKYSKRTSLIH